VFFFVSSIWLIFIFFGWFKNQNIQLVNSKSSSHLETARSMNYIEDSKAKVVHLHGKETCITLGWHKIPTQSSTCEFKGDHKPRIIQSRSFDEFLSLHNLAKQHRFEWQFWNLISMQLGLDSSELLPQFYFSKSQNSCKWQLYIPTLISLCLLGLIFIS
jgi:hypothetical protein